MSYFPAVWLLSSLKKKLWSLWKLRSLKTSYLSIKEPGWYVMQILWSLWKRNYLLRIEVSFLHISRKLSFCHFWNLLAECMYIDIILSFYHLFVPVKYELCMSFLSYQVWTEHVILILSSENCFLSFLFCIQVSENGHCHSSVNWIGHLL